MPSSSHTPLLLPLRRYARRRWLHVSQHLEHQWTSLSEPAVLPVATEATVEHELKRLGNTELLNWNLEVAGLSLDRSSPPPASPHVSPPSSSLYRWRGWRRRTWRCRMRCR